MTVHFVVAPVPTEQELLSSSVQRSVAQEQGKGQNNVAMIIRRRIHFDD